MTSTPQNRRDPLRTVLDSFTGDERTAVQSWAETVGDHRSGQLFGDHEHGGRPIVDDRDRPAADDPSAIRTVGVIGGGTAGYLTALALRAKRPWLRVVLVESRTIPIIGVGEATVPSMVPFLHHYLGVDPAELYREVRPTWKMGIRFDWGANPAGFLAPFDWNANSVGLLGSLATQGDINAFTVQSLLMAAGRAPVFEVEGEFVSLMKYLPFAYHLDNGRFVGFLTRLAERRGVEHVDATIGEVVLAGAETVDHLRTTDGQELRYDFYVDCTGFRSRLLGQALGTPFHPYADSLFTDSAVTGNVPHHGRIKPYTSAVTMDAGWSWNIPTPEEDHLGYVYSSAAISDEAAAAELARRFPGVSAPRQVRFRSGRHSAAWRGNVMAVGNSYAFVEPLESSGLMMITLSVLALVSSLPTSWSQPTSREVVNAALAQKWDAIRWFLSLHYRFNGRLDTPFWRDARQRVDVSGLEPLLEVFRAGAPLRFRDSITRGFLESTAPTFYGLEGVDCILLGQQVDARLLPTTEPLERWRQRKAGADALVGRALPTAAALDAFAREPRLHHELLEDEDSWVVATGTDRLVRNEPPPRPTRSVTEPAAV